MQTSNPAMAVITRAASSGEFNFGGTGDIATISGATSKSILLVLATFVTGYASMIYSLNQIINDGSFPAVLLYGSLIVAVVLAFITIFKPEKAPITSVLYALAEGGALGSLSAMFELKYPGIVATAVMSTFVVVLAMLALWKFKIIVVTERFRSILIGATCGVAVLYLLNMICSLFGFPLLPSTGAMSIGISLVVCTIAAFNLVLDFDNMDQAVQQGLPKYFESYCAFSLLVTICWLYVEILNLLSKRE